jgi:hypothetical protein
MLGLRMQSWALWLAEALELPYTCLARDGARAPDALTDQAPRLQGPYELGCLYLGINDVRAPGFEPGPYAEALRELATALAACCRRLLLVALPPTIGAPPAPGWAIAAANEKIAALADRCGATLVTLESLTGPELVLPDAVHLTARGEAHLALLACRALSAAGTVAEEGDLRQALKPLSLRARARWLLLARPPALARDLRRRWTEEIRRRLERAR